MDKKKAVFFDIDGTLWDSSNYIPDSTRRAIEKIQKGGNLVFLCTGRSRAFIKDPGLLSLGFDGIISGCGTMIEYQGKVLFYHKLDAALTAYAINTLRHYGFRPILEGCQYLYMDEEDFSGDAFGQKIKREMGDKLLSISGEWGKWEISKLSCAMVPEGREACFAKLNKDFDFMVHNPYVAELVPKGFHKGTGVAWLCEYLHMDLKNAYAFGDSINDLGMLKTAGTAIVMGNGSEEAKKEADYVTASLEEDGIWKACEHFQLWK